MMFSGFFTHSATGLYSPGKIQPGQTGRDDGSNLDLTERLPSQPWRLVAPVMRGHEFVNAGRSSRLRYEASRKAGCTGRVSGKL